MALFPVSIRDSDRRLALAVRGTGLLWHPRPGLTLQTWRELVDVDADRGGVRFLEGVVSSSLWARATTMGKRLVYLPQGFSERPLFDRLRVKSHELRHTDEYPKHFAFRFRYIAPDPRFRWAVECQGKIAELRLVVAAGEGRHLDDLIHAFAQRLDDPFPGYACGRIRNLEAETVRLLRGALA